MSKETCNHAPDFTTTQPANGIESSGIVDVWCSKCGKSGSTRIDPDEIQWEESQEGN